jgi:hypothetical protein
MAVANLLQETLVYIDEVLESEVYLVRLSMQSPCRGYALPKQCTQRVIGRDEASGSEALGRNGFELLTRMIQKSSVLFLANFLVHFAWRNCTHLLVLLFKPTWVTLELSAPVNILEHSKMLLFAPCIISCEFLSPSSFPLASSGVTFLDEEFGSKAFRRHRPDFVLASK